MILSELKRERAIDILARYIKEPDMYISFVDVNKLGINPKPIDKTTPIGIYAYPLLYAMEIPEIPFASFRNYICLFKATGKIQKLQDYDQSNYTKDHKLFLETLIQYTPSPIIARKLLEKWENSFSHGSLGYRFWKISQLVARRIAVTKGNPDATPIIWNKLLRNLGYQIILDDGHNIIHSVEHTQAVFLSKEYCQVVKMIVNDFNGLPVKNGFI